jgi:hypothetical protein
MHANARTRLACLVAGGLLALGDIGLAQQPVPGTTPPNPARQGYYGRVRTQAPAPAPSTAPVRGGRYGGRLDGTAALSARGMASGDRLGNAPDPLRAYGEPVRGTSLARPYEPAPAVTPPPHEIPAPPASHNYYPGLRPGQGPNHNGVPHRCVPGRHSFLGR